MVATPNSLPAPGPRASAAALLTLGLPLIGSHLAQFAIQMTDTVMLGWYDVEALAGLVIAGAVYFVLFLVGSGFAWAVMPMVASAAGTEDDRQVRRVTRMGLWLSALFGILALPPMLAAEPLLLSLGQEPAVARQAGLYLAIAGWGLMPNLLIMVLKSYLAALGRTAVVLWVTLASAVLNAALNYALIFGNLGAPEMGIAGAAVASVTLQVAGLLALVVYAARVTPEYALFRNLHRPDWDAFGQVFRLGWPIGLTSLAEVGLFAASSVMMGWIGTVPLAAHGIALNIASATFMVHVGLSQAATVCAGRAYGRKDEADLRLGAGVAYGISLLFAGATMVVFLVFPEPLIGLFLDPDDPARPAIMAAGVTLLAVAALFQLADAAQVMALGVLRGVRDTRVPMIMAAVSYWAVGLPASYVAGFRLGWEGLGVWAGLVLGLALAGVLLSHRFWTRSSRLGSGTAGPSDRSAATP